MEATAGYKQCVTAYLLPSPPQSHGRDHLPPIRDVPEDVETLKLNQFEMKSCVGGLVKSFERKAA